ncbi:hypothetical protein [Flavobacterium sp. CLA17]|uniref:hypothetical protein n=1 Tax=Flavobacterium sp. CLA17 TaxID=2724135 RepID=UPI001492D57B|nr:hypothetical protein [Flavobacterium sp. CLA17]QSB27793.1 hypothetical protein HAV12_003305 [Flavobacterium sp. CLA17]
MKTKQEESATDFLKLVKNMKYFTKLKSDNSNGDLFNVTLKTASYNELNLMVSCLLKASICALKNDNSGYSSASESGIDVLLLLEMALQLLPDEEMQLLDEFHKNAIDRKAEQ